MACAQHGEVGADEGGAHAVALAHRRLELGPVTVAAENKNNSKLICQF